MSEFVSGLSHVVLHVRDMNESVDFYQNLFGWQLLFDDSFEGPDFSAAVQHENAKVRTVGGRVGYLRLEFVRTSWTPDMPPQESLGLSCLTFQVTDAQAFHDHCVAAGAKVSGPPHTVSGCSLFFMEDPNGQKLEIVQYLPGANAWGGPDEGPHPLNHGDGA